jgi:heptaprenyl diphosphate synthase
LRIDLDGFGAPKAEALAAVWRYGLSAEGKQTRVRVLRAAEIASRRGEGVADERVPTAAWAVELLHLGSLAHDDIADGGSMRRGLPSLPTFFGAPLAAAGGAAFFGRGLGLFAQCGGSAVALAAEAATRACEGQMRELRSLHDTSRTPADYFEAVQGKSAAIFSLAARLGGELGHAEPATLDALASYGNALGVAHQIIDDVLDLTAGSEQTGKRQGNDLENGNYTLPVIYALEESWELADAIQDDAAVDVVIELILDTDAVARANDDARRWIAEARESVRGLCATELLAIADEESAALEGAWT